MNESNTTSVTAPPSRQGAPWFRLLLLISYVAAAGLLVAYEWNAREVLAKAHQLEAQKKYVTAAVAYGLILEQYPFSFSVPEARAGTLRTDGALAGSGLATPSAPSVPEKLLGREFAPEHVDWLPLGGSALVAATAILVAATRLKRRRGISLLALGLGAGATGLLVAQLGYHGVAVFDFAAKVGAKFVAHPQGLYFATYLTAVATAGLTLTAVSKRPAPADSAAVDAHPARTKDASRRSPRPILLADAPAGGYVRDPEP